MFFKRAIVSKSSNKLQICLFSSSVQLPKTLEDGANSVQANQFQESNNSSDERVTEPQPVNDLTTKVERFVFGFFVDFLSILKYCD